MQEDLLRLIGRSRRIVIQREDHGRRIFLNVIARSSQIIVCSDRGIIDAQHVQTHRADTRQAILNVVIDNVLESVFTEEVGVRRV